jgi:hypothetical protein
MDPSSEPSFRPTISFAPSVLPTSTPSLAPSYAPVLLATKSNSKDSGVLVGIIVGIVVAVVFFVLAVGLLFYWYYYIFLKEQAIDPEEFEITKSDKWAKDLTYDEEGRPSNVNSDVTPRLSSAGRDSYVGRASDVFMLINPNSAKAPTRKWNEIFNRTPHTAKPPVIDLQ